MGNIFATRVPNAVRYLFDKTTLSNSLNRLEYMLTVLCCRYYLNYHVTTLALDFLYFLLPSTLHPSAIFSKEEIKILKINLKFFSYSYK